MKSDSKKEVETIKAKLKEREKEVEELKTELVESKKKIEAQKAEIEALKNANNKVVLAKEEEQKAVTPALNPVAVKNISGLITTLSHMAGEYEKIINKNDRPRCKDGSLDMRFAVNRGMDKYGTPHKVDEATKKILSQL